MLSVTTEDVGTQLQANKAGESLHELQSPFVFA
jgi:hypothetical protein